MESGTGFSLWVRQSYTAPVETPSWSCAVKGSFHAPIGTPFHDSIHEMGYAAAVYVRGVFQVEMAWIKTTK
jgi:hypothetical protein